MKTLIAATRKFNYGDKSINRKGNGKGIEHLQINCSIDAS